MSNQNIMIVNRLNVLIGAKGLINLFALLLLCLFIIMHLVA